MTKDKKVVVDAIGELARLQIGVVERYLENLDSFYRQEFARLEELMKEADPDYAEVLIDEHISELEVTALGEQLAIVALYCVAELGTVRVLRWHYGDRAKRLYRYEQLEPALRTDFNTDMRTLSGYDSMNEARLINNAVKHDGRVTKVLADKYASWKDGEELKDLRKAFERLTPGIIDFLMALGVVVIPKNASGQKR